MRRRPRLSYNLLAEAAADWDPIGVAEHPERIPVRRSWLMEVTSAIRIPKSAMHSGPDWTQLTWDRVPSGPRYRSKELAGRKDATYSMGHGPEAVDTNGETDVPSGARALP